VYYHRQRRYDAYSDTSFGESATVRRLRRIRRDSGIKAKEPMKRFFILFEFKSAFASAVVATIVFACSSSPGESTIILPDGSIIADAQTNTASNAGNADATSPDVGYGGVGGGSGGVGGGLSESAGTSGASANTTVADSGGQGGSTGSAGSDATLEQDSGGIEAGTNPNSCAPAASSLVGWASVEGNGVTTTTGGDGGPTISVGDISALQNAVKGTEKQVIEINSSLEGVVSIGSNKTLVGCPGAQLKGHISLNKSANVIIRNLVMVGYNCSDSPADCSKGDDTITVQGGAHHLWFDHDDISDGSDGNLDMTHAVDYVTVSWTKFHYSGRRTDAAGTPAAHQFSNLVGHSDDNASEDVGHLRITFHHNWWADNVVERMPRVRFGQVHIFNNLYTASGNDYCIGVGVGANILTENNVFIGVKTPIETTSYSDSASIIRSIDNVYTLTSGDPPLDRRAESVFAPPYPYLPENTSVLEAAIRAGAGPQ
jgi:pectate lyase